MIHQLRNIAVGGTKSIRVLCNDTDVFVWLLYYLSGLQLKCHLTMEGTSSGRALIYIGATARQHQEIVPRLPGAHTLIGQCYDIGKSTAINLLLVGNKLDKFGDIEAETEELIAKATNFIGTYYGSKKTGIQNMSDVRQDICSIKTAEKKSTSAPGTRILRPTTEAFQQNVLRAHVQTAIWKAAWRSEPPALDPTSYGWEHDKPSKTLTPKMLPTSCALSPPEVLEMIRCGCASDRPCFIAQCRCKAATLPCTLFCDDESNSE